MTVGEIYNLIDRFAPFDTQLDFDNSGLNIGCMNTIVKKAAVALDATKEVIEKAAESGCNLLVTHHPIIFDPLKSMETDTPAYLCAKYGIDVISAHTNADKAKGGVNDLLAAKIGLEDVKVICDANNENMVRAGFANFDSCDSFARHLKDSLCCSVRYVDNGRPIKKVAVCGGSGASFIDDAILGNCDAMVMGEAKHNNRLDAKNKGLALFECGHFNTEKYIVNVFAEIIKSAGMACEIIEQTDPAKYI